MNLTYIKKAFAKTGKSKSGLAEALDVANSAISELLAGRRAIKADEVPLITKYLELDRIPIVGRVGLGGLIVPAGDGALGMIRLPFAPPDEVVAFDIPDNTSMYPRYQAGDAIVCWLKQRRPLVSFVGEEVVVETRDGRRFLRHLMAGSRAGLTTLHSFNAPPVENARPTWVGEIYLTVRAAQRQLLEDRPAGRRRAAGAARGAGK